MSTWERQCYGDDSGNLLGVTFQPDAIRFSLSDVSEGVGSAGEVLLGVVDLCPRDAENLMDQLSVFLAFQAHPEKSWQATFRAFVAAGFGHGAAARVADIEEEVNNG